MLSRSTLLIPLSHAPGKSLFAANAEHAREMVYFLEVLETHHCALAYRPITPKHVWLFVPFFVSTSDIDPLVYVEISRLLGARTHRIVAALGGADPESAVPATGSSCER